jgi:mono/diheme cytochrome c family protein
MRRPLARVKTSDMVWPGMRRIKAGAEAMGSRRMGSQGLNFGLAAGALLALNASASAQDAARLAAGEAAWNRAGCLQCHGTSGEGGAGGEFPAGPSLRTTFLDRAGLAETISCGRPGSPMPAWLDGAYTKFSCYGMALGPAPADVDLMPVLTSEEIQALVDYLIAKIVRK